MVAARAVAMLGPLAMARARVRLWAMPMQVSQALLALNFSDGKWAVDEFGKDLLDDRVAAVVFFGLDQDERAVGEDGVVTPDREQHTLLVHCGLPLVGRAAHDQPGGDLPAGAGERGVGGLGDLGSGDEPLLVSVPYRVRVGALDPRALVDGGDGGPDLLVDRDGDREADLGPRQAAMTFLP
jgi:hypothetical protein